VLYNNYHNFNSLFEVLHGVLLIFLMAFFGIFNFLMALFGIFNFLMALFGIWNFLLDLFRICPISSMLHPGTFYGRHCSIDVRLNLFSLALEKQLLGFVEVLDCGLELVLLNEGDSLRQVQVV
jgi:hypothetical protein